MFPAGRSVSAGSPARKVRPNMTQRYFMIFVANFQNIKKQRWLTKKNTFHSPGERQSAPLCQAAASKWEKTFDLFGKKTFLANSSSEPEKNFKKRGRKDISHFRVVSRILIARCFIWQPPYLPIPPLSHVLMHVFSNWTEHSKHLKHLPTCTIS